MADRSPLLEVRQLDVDYWQQNRWLTVVEGLNLEVSVGETFGLVGESGCGKSTTANAMLGYRPAGCRYRNASVIFEEKDLLTLPAKELRRLVGSKISLVTQNPATALSPGMQVGKQIVETLLVHRYCSNETEARKRTLDLFRRVSLPSPERIYEKYPHQLSGGQQQRILVAMALACDPRLVVLDEPTTGLDVTTQAQVLDLLTDLRARYGLAMFYITHNLGVVAQICERIGVMYAGQLVEVAPRHELFSQPRHPYTHGLIASVPRMSAPNRKHRRRGQDRPVAGAATQIARQPISMSASDGRSIAGTGQKGSSRSRACKIRIADPCSFTMASCTGCRRPSSPGAGSQSSISRCRRRWAAGGCRR